MTFGVGGANSPRAATRPTFRGPKLSELDDSLQRLEKRIDSHRSPLGSVGRTQVIDGIRDDAVAMEVFDAVSSHPRIRRSEWQYSTVDGDRRLTLREVPQIDFSSWAVDQITGALQQARVGLAALDVDGNGILGAHEIRTKLIGSLVEEAIHAAIAPFIADYRDEVDAWHDANVDSSKN